MFDKMIGVGRSRRGGRRFAPALALVLVQLVVQCAVAADPSEDWSIRFLANAKSDFDRWTERPNARLQAWMVDNYSRMLTYSPYFDSRVSWYPNAWVYRDLYAVYPESSVFREHPEWVLRDAEGQLLYIPFGCSRGRCPQYAADVGNPDFRRYWIDRLRSILERGYRGVYIDDVNLEWRVSNGRGEHVKPIDDRTGKPMLLADWRRYFAEFAEQVRAELPDFEIVHNVIWTTAPADDPFVARQMLAADYINLERGASDSGIRGGSGKYGFETFLAYIDRVHALGRNIVLEDDDSDSLQERDYELAAYFLVRQPDDLVSADGDRSRMSPDSFWDGYRTNLGAPLGHRVFTPERVYRRDYACGMVMLNPPNAPPRRIALDRGYVDIDGRDVDSVTLRAASGVVLRDSQCVND